MTRAALALAGLVACAGCESLFDGADLHGRGGDGGRDLAVASDGGGGGGDLGPLPPDLSIGPRCQSPSASLNFALADADTLQPSPMLVASGDFVADTGGRIDIVTADVGADKVTVLTNMPGVLANPQSYAACTHPTGLAAARFSTAAQPNIIVSCYDDATHKSALVRLAPVAGLGYGAASAIAVYDGNHPTALVAVDLNHDGIDDLAIANQDSDSITVILKNSATIGAPFLVHTIALNNFHPVALAAGDLDGNQWNDLVAVNESNELAVMTSTATPGGFNVVQPQTNQTARYTRVAVVDLNRDQHPDVALANLDKSEIHVLLNLGGGVLDADHAKVSTIVTNTGGVQGVTAFAFADFDCDGRVDVAASNALLNDVSFLRGDGQGGFKDLVPTSFTVSSPTSLMVTDLDGDGLADVVAGRSGGSAITTLTNRPPKP